MSIVRCPACDRRMSSAAKACPHCHEPVGELSEPDRERLLVRRWRDRIYRARNLTYLAMTLVVAGMIAWWLTGPPGLALPIALVPGLLVGVGFVGYIASWSWLIWLRMLQDPRKRQD